MDVWVGVGGQESSGGDTILGVEWDNADANLFRGTVTVKEPGFGSFAEDPYGAGVVGS